MKRAFEQLPQIVGALAFIVSLLAVFAPPLVTIVKDLSPQSMAEASVERVVEAGR